MSVNTSEEYLDELLQAIEPIIYANDPVPEPEIIQENIVDVSDTLDSSLDNLMEMNFSEQEISEVEELVTTEENIELADLFSETTDILEPVENVGDVSVDDLLAALASEDVGADMEDSGEVLDIDAMLNAAANVGENTPISEVNHDADVKALLQQFTDDDDLSDIGEILARNDNNEAVVESMLETPDVEVFQLDESVETDSEEKKESKGLFGLFKKKNKKDKNKNKKVEESAPDDGLTSESSVADTIELLDESSMEIMPETDFFAEFAGEEINVGAEESAESLNLEEMSLDDIFAEGEMTDIDQLLSAGSFDEVGIPTMAIGGDLDSIEERPPKNKAKGDKKETFFSRVFAMLTEEDDEEEPKKGSIPEAALTGITDENEGILEELSKEEKKKRKKEEKEQKKKEKEAKKKGKNVSEGEEAEDDEESDDKKKKKKKVKKQKIRKVIDIDAKPEKKLSKKKVSIVFAFCFTILALILIMHTVLLNVSNIKEARWAFDNADYETCYANLYGEKRSEEDEEIFQKSYIILTVQRKLDSYLNFKQMDMKVEALNALFEGVKVYRDMEARAEGYGILSRITPIYETIYSELKSYGLSDADIEEILAYESKVSYTKRLESIAYGTPFVMDEWLPEIQEPEVEESVEEPKPLEDVLPMEEDFLLDDTSLLNEMNFIGDVQVQNEPEAEMPIEQEQGNTVVVGSSPVDISGSTQDGLNVGGTNVGNGSTNISAEVNGNNVFVN